MCRRSLVFDFISFLVDITITLPGTVVKKTINGIAILISALEDFLGGFYFGV